MVVIAKEDDLRIGSGRTARFEGGAYGSGVSFFHVHNTEGQGPDAHVHPYSETWVVLAGQALFRTADGEGLAGQGDVVVVGAGTAHAFRAVGPEPLRMMCIHASPRIEQDFLDDDAAAEAGVTF
ncbi:cupin domain-containing protein [Amycolatopsis sp. Hca4]|uniref:cupin domain-containing protein n=1 Tax=unclassified Amycolatopsis TaxID=2618356 RepID=UPI0015900906|nr:cupin domain-containing protein [Amycolatopsis sp. Hca4]QKV73347.1 cupin domain-containing protein [Amycolatopsis sp. Hca4]